MNDNGPGDIPLIKAVDIHKYFDLKTRRIYILKGVNFEVMKGEMMGIVGASGAGKSTLLHIMGTIDRPSSGKILFKGADIFLWDDNALARFRNERIGFIFQFHYLLPEFDALENTMMPALIRGMSRNEAGERAKELLSEVGLKDRVYHRPGELSGGEQQRVAIARALINDPELILADEPTGNLDQKTGESIMELMRRFNKDKGKTFVIVTHSYNLALKIDKISTLIDGLISSN